MTSGQLNCIRAVISCKPSNLPALGLCFNAKLCLSLLGDYSAHLSRRYRLKISGVHVKLKERIEDGKLADIHVKNEDVTETAHRTGLP